MSDTPMPVVFREGDTITLEILTATQFYKELGTHEKIDLKPDTFKGDIVQWDNMLYIRITLKAGYGYKSLGDVLQLCRREMRSLSISKA
jgi:hypothetical protein